MLQVTESAEGSFSGTQFHFGVSDRDALGSQLCSQLCFTFT